MAHELRIRFALVVCGLVFSGAPAPAQFSIVINADSGLAANAEALAAFQRAGQAWSSRITSTGAVNVQIAAGLADLGNPLVIANASTSSVSTSFDTVRNAMAARSGTTGLSVLSSLPTSATFNANVPSGVSLSGSLAMSRANAKVLGFISGTSTTTDSTITFNSTFGFDYNRADGIGSGLVDFETVAIHEIGHALGFISVVDRIDAGQTTVTPFSWDLFRFNNAAAPTSAAEFAANAREFRPGQEALQHDMTTGYRLSTGATGGDGSQASHWKADEILGTNIGVMDPSLATGVQFDPTAADFRALELIGYNVTPVPEPATVLGMATAALFLARRVRRRDTETPPLAA